MTFGPRRLVALLVLVCVVYLGIVAHRGVLLVRSGDPVAVLLGVGVLLLPVVGAVVLWREVRFGRDAQQLTRVLESEGRLPLPLPKDSDPAAADEAFGHRRTAVEAAPRDWRAWTLLALAYEDARDVPRVRRAMRHAIALEAEDRPRG
ncbi:MAG: hypothetical protein ACRDYU_01695 [Actinomycetes bacterium]